MQYNRIYQSICSEIDCLFKELCRQVDAIIKVENIKNYRKVVQANFKYFNEQQRLKVINARECLTLKKTRLPSYC